VLVQAETVRVGAFPTVDDAVTFNELLIRGARGGRTWDAWPGAPVDEGWNPAPRAYPLQPVPSEQQGNPVRLRRLLHDEPRRAVVIGVTDRIEGYLQPGGDRLYPPGRNITLVEVAFVVSSGPAKVALAHPNDLQPVPRPPEHR
jgi:hypothetical protein